MTVTFIRALIIYFFVITAVRLMGKRQVGELKPHELVITILLSAIAVIPLEENSMPLANCLVPIMLFISLEILVAALSMKSLKFRNLIQGRPIFIIRKGKLDQKKLRELRFTVDDIVDALRQKDIFDLSEVEDAIIETNGSISVLPKAENKPLTPADVGISVEEKGMPIAIVMDGKPVNEYFNECKIKDSEIELILQTQNRDVKKIMLLTIDDNGNTYLINKENTK
ncbi:MAG: DUF421 domain-containing protein [Eubacteriales bacterium]|nr:DUF421 domain-containing protein [Eubacteriales bacterium]